MLRGRGKMEHNCGRFLDAACVEVMEIENDECTWMRLMVANLGNIKLRLKRDRRASVHM